ncbi:hypothetical protein NQ317_016738 [Molorchus minor]|uniref:Ionotropic glutamate receptor C-terminal domain-containing protein n=1 Tax=Molorchus minor TaxID=1323400 RepID=A0ABQ9IVA5_9CUCU|nr:hypothetical protein NQ317_016738 [Molorchus minor]
MSNVIIACFGTSSIALYQPYKIGVNDNLSVSLILSPDRQMIVEYLKSYGYWSTKSKFILKKPSTSYMLNIYYMTFAGGVWIASLVVLLTFAVVLYVLLNWEIKFLNNDRHTRFTVSDTTLLSLEAICQQGTLVDSKVFSGRILILILFTAFMFIYVAYSSNILVLLQSTIPIASIRQLVDSRIECGGFNVSFMANYYTCLNDTLSWLTNNSILFNKHIMTAVIHEGDVCDTSRSIFRFQDEMYIVVPKTSQYKKLFKTGLLLGEERGLQNRVKHRMSHKPKCYNEAGNFQSVRIYDCYSVFMLYISGVLISLTVLCFEKLIHANYPANIPT